MAWFARWTASTGKHVGQAGAVQVRSRGRLARASGLGLGLALRWMDGCLIGDDSVIICVSYNGLSPSIGPYRIRMYVGWLHASQPGRLRTCVA